MISFNEWQQAISAKIEQAGKDGATVHPDWVTQAVMLTYPKIRGEDVDFHLFGSRAAVRSEVTTQINKLEKSDDGKRQGTLAGFDFLQEFYVIERDKVMVAVSIYDMTDAEIDRKADEKDAMALACSKHAAELRRFKRIRKQGRRA